MLRACLVALVVLASCAPQSQLPKADQAKVEEETRIQRRMAFEMGLRMDVRFRAVSTRLALAAAEMCGDKVNYAAGFVPAGPAMFNDETKVLASTVIGVHGSSAKIMEIIPNSPAESAGLRVGDLITKVNGKLFLSPENQKDDGTGDAVYELIRDEYPMEITVRRKKACSYKSKLIDRPEINAFADGSSVNVTTAMMRFAQDDNELALVVGHELAHNFRGHIDAKMGNAMAGQVVGAILDGILGAVLKAPTGGAMGNAMGQAGAGAYSQDFEREADYAGLYVMARAGYDISNAPNFWRRMAVANPKGISHASSHPATPERFVNLEAAIAEIKDKQAKGLPLVPNEKPKTATMQDQEKPL